MGIKPGWDRSALAPSSHRVTIEEGLQRSNLMSKD
jgi:hypothetical protein